MITIDIGSMFLISLLLSFLTVGVVGIIVLIKIKKQNKIEAEKQQNSLDFYYGDYYMCDSPI